MTGSAQPILVAGAGIAGLAFAIRCMQLGLPVRVLEARDAPTTDGAGIQLGPNATRVLELLGVAATLAPDVCKPERIVVRAGQAGNVLKRLPLGNWIADRHGAPYWVMHRADLHRALTHVLKTEHGVTPAYGWQSSQFDEHGRGILVTSVDGETVHGACLVAADGLWSHHRASVVDRTHAVPYSGKSAARAVIAREDAAFEMNDQEVGVWFSPNGHLVHYPISAGQSFAVVAVTARERAVQGWGTPQPTGEMVGDVARIAPAIATAWAGGAEWRMWALFDPQPLSRLHAGRACLIGDAAHPVLPFLAQGGGLALEDAVVLADLIARHGLDAGELGVAFSEYQRRRAPRTARVQATSRRNGRVYQLGGPAALARNLALTAMSGERIMAGYDWLYGWRPGQPVSPD